MISGADQVDVSSCTTITPMSGFNPARKLVLVRNPNYDQATDTTRANYLDGVQITVDTDLADIYAKIGTGELDGSFDTTPPSSVVSQYLGDPGLKPLLHANPTNEVDYLTMNLLVPPFSDVHVRRAANWIMNKAGIRTAQGGKVYGASTGRIYPPALMPGTSYDPYATTGDAGDLAKAKAEMKLSAYDRNGDGICDKPACDVAPFLVWNDGQFPAMASVVVKSLAKIGIVLTVKKVDRDTFWSTIGSPSKLVPIAAFAGWIADYPDPYQFGFFLFSSSNISCSWQLNYSEVGMTRAQAKACGDSVLAAWNAATSSGAKPLPSVDAAVDSCSALTGAARSTCWAKLENTLMMKVVPWVPIRVTNRIDIMSPNVSDYEFDQEAAGLVSLCHLALVSA
jgi:peptide/nickel transport system substrate-binding protein